MFLWGYNADNPHHLVAVSSSQRGTLGFVPPCIPEDFFPISSGTITGNMPDGEPTTCIKFNNLHKNSRQSLRQQICHKALFVAIQSDPDQQQLGCVGTKWWDKFGITNFPLALSGWAMSFDFRSHIANEAIIIFGLGTYGEYSTHWQQNSQG